MQIAAFNIMKSYLYFSVCALAGVGLCSHLSAIPERPAPFTKVDPSTVSCFLSEDYRNEPLGVSPDGKNILSLEPEYDAKDQNGAKIKIPVVLLSAIYRGGVPGPLVVAGARRIGGASFNRDGSKIAVLCSLGEDLDVMDLEIYDVATRNIVLVKINYISRPAVRISWVSSGRIVFKGAFGGALDLDTLRRDAATPQEWDEANGKSAITNLRIENAGGIFYLKQENETFGKALHAAFGLYDVPFLSPDGTFAIVRQRLLYLRTEGEAWPKVVSLKNEGLCALTPEDEKAVKVAFGRAYEGVEIKKPDSLIRAQICKPRINPLNGKVIGPDLERVVGEGLLVKGAGNRIMLQLGNVHEFPAPGDIVSDFNCGASTGVSISRNASMVITYE